MSVWSDYLRTQADLADHLARTLPTPGAREDFAEIAGGFRRGAEIEDAAPTHARLTMPLGPGYPPLSWST